MGEIKEQKIVVILSLADSDHILIENGIRLATIFKKELCILIHTKKKLKSIPREWEHQLENHVRNCVNKYPGLIVSKLILTAINRSLPEKLADTIEAILIVTSATSFSEYSGALSVSPIPFLFVDENYAEISALKKIMLATDLRKENKDSSLWSSYFGRFNQSEIIVIAANDRFKEAQRQVAKNVIFSKKLYKKFKLTHKIFKGTKSSLGNASEALELCKTSGCDLLILLGSSTITPLDLLFGLPEKKIVNRAVKLPVLIVNPRKDNYILCD